MILYSEIRKKNPPRPMQHSRILSKILLPGSCIAVNVVSAMVRRPYQKRGQEDTLLCPYTSCSTVSSKLSLVEAAVLLNGIQDLVDEYQAQHDAISLPGA